jgi:uncharacterized protein (TIGR03000 family)
MLAMTNGADLPAFGGGCRGCRGCSGCSGCSGCYGGYGCSGCYGGGYGCRGGGYGCYGGGYGCYGGGYGCHGGGYGCSAGYGGAGCCGGYGGRPAAPPVPPAPAPTEKPKGEALGPAPATIIVGLPAGATLTIDDTPTSTTSANRVFQTPPLQGGYEYFYTLKAEAMQDGKPVQVTNRITVRAGETTRVRLEFPLANVAGE